MGFVLRGRQDVAGAAEPAQCSRAAAGWTLRLDGADRGAWGLAGGYGWSRLGAALIRWFRYRNVK